ncbi:NADH-quinone oxidoreductase subunit J [Ornithinimicrobium ciconiae]|uniref:NADH-quinone oxidoreductase subunit J n=1 Tax=Ornithinimicrobium ciconiae TaxID=2594265 RepID=A0A516G890_9MICO|nr:NADH-quinone oxidoreductase subunit J [Ornithinimicrobium ciconiae]QDO87743.1 NADH-quinone oxidoreductase subunit J [Ornithinimicrobium ciconiae]
MTSRDVLFAAVGLITAAAAVLSVTSRRVLHAGLWLVVALGGVAGCYLVLGAELVALVQLLVYVGAVVVLVLFALMLTRTGVAEVDSTPGQRWLAAAIGAGVTVLVGGTLIAAYGWQERPVTGASNEQIGEQIFGTWVWPFELLSLLLLAALVAAVAVATTGRRAGAEQGSGVKAVAGADSRSGGER